MEYLCKKSFLYDFKYESQTKGRGDIMSDWNEQAAPNNNIPPRIVRPYERRDQSVNHEFSEELADGGERDDFIQHQKKIKK
jgi:hypothetical protein